jgi:hypothetical protein
MVLNFLRFRQRPPGKTPPPNNRVDVFHDPEAGKLVARDSQGNPVLFDSAAGGATWGAITGTLASQTDLQAALNAKAASSHTHVSAAVTDATSDGVLNSEKLLKTDPSGDLIIRNVVFANIETEFRFALGETSGLSASRGATAPDASGTLGVLRAYANSTAANAAVSVGDAWWDTTLKKARVRLT